MSNKSNSPWFFGEINRIHAEIILFTYPKGTFLVRQKQFPDIPNTLEYTLSVRDSNMTERPPNIKSKLYSIGGPIKHYSIKYEEDIGYFIKRDRTFPTIEEMIAFYKRCIYATDGLCAPLLQVHPPRVMTDDRWELDKADLTYVKPLGRGSWGYVNLGLWRGVLPVAVKCCSRSLEPYDFIYEANVMKTLKHENIVQLFGVCLNQPTYYIVIEYCAYKNILDYMQKHIHQPLTLSMILKIAQQIANGMTYIESKGLVHRDLAARNILVSYINDSEQVVEVKISDFGHCRPEGFLLSEHDLKHNIPVKWTAIEIFEEGTFTTKSDIWSFGIVMIELFGEIPYGLTIQNPTEVIDLIRRGERTPKPDQCPPAIYQKCMECWDKTPSKRPNFTELTDFVSVYQTRNKSGAK